MVGIQINIGDSLSALVQHVLDGNGSVTIDTKSRGRRASGVMHSASKSHDTVHIASPQCQPGVLWPRPGILGQYDLMINAVGKVRAMLGNPGHQLLNPGDMCQSGSIL